MNLRLVPVLCLAAWLVCALGVAHGATIPYTASDGAQFALGDTVTINKEDEMVWPVTCVASSTGACGIGESWRLYAPGTGPASPPTMRPDMEPLDGQGLFPNFGPFPQGCDPSYPGAGCQTIPVGKTVSAYFYAWGSAGKNSFIEQQSMYRAWLHRHEGTVYGDLCAAGNWMMCGGSAQGPDPATLAVKVDASHALPPLPPYVSVSNLTVNGKGHGTIRITCRSGSVHSCRVAVVVTAPGGTSASYFIETHGEVILPRGTTRTVALVPAVHAAPGLWVGAHSVLVEVDACDTARPYCIHNAFQGKEFRADLQQETGLKLPVQHK